MRPVVGVALRGDDVGLSGSTPWNLYVMVAPLSLGHHSIHFHGASGAFVLDITYHIYVYR